jgi:hypothetical protein
MSGPLHALNPGGYTPGDTSGHALGDSGSPISSQPVTSPITSTPTPYSSNTGGVGTFIATEEELLRVSADLLLAATSLATELAPIQWVQSPWAHALYAIELPSMLAKLWHVQQGCINAGVSYFKEEWALAHKIDVINVPKINNDLLGGNLGRTPTTLDSGNGSGNDDGNYDNNAIPIVPSPAQGSNGNQDIVKPIFGTPKVPIGSHTTPFKPTPAIDCAPIGSKQSLPAPSSLDAMARRMQSSYSSGLDVVRLEEYVRSDGHKQFVIYLPGTQHWNPLDTKNELDPAQNFAALANMHHVPTQHQVTNILAQHNIGSHDHLTIVGHSQGALVGAKFAESKHNFHIDGLLTLGAPLGQEHLPQGIRVLSIENTDDFVPRLDDAPNSQTQDWLTVQAHSQNSKGHAWFAPHSAAAYEKTAKLVDQSANRELLIAKDQLLAPFSDAQSGHVTVYHLKG